MVQMTITVHIDLHVIYYSHVIDYSQNGMVLILICAPSDIHSKMSPIFLTSRHVTLSVQVISELRIPILGDTFPNSLFNVSV